MLSSQHSAEHNPWDDEPTVISSPLQLTAARPDKAPMRESTAHIGLTAPSRARTRSTQPLPPTPSAARAASTPAQLVISRPQPSAAGELWRRLELSVLLRDPASWLGNTQRALLVLSLLSTGAALTLLYFVSQLAR